MKSKSSKGSNDIGDSQVQITREIIKQRLDAVQKGHQADYSRIDASIKIVLEEMGITLKPKSQNPLFVKMKEILKLSKEQLDALPYISNVLQSNADLALKEVLEGEEIECLFTGNYAKVGILDKQSFFSGGRTIPHSISVLSRFKSKPHVIFFEFDLARRVWNVTIAGETCEDLMKMIDQKISELVNRLFKGKELNNGWNPVTLKRKSRRELVYPPGIGKQIDDLCRVFKNWEKSPHVYQWTYLLTGDVGCGKTTVGGLLVGLRDKNCTVMYYHASELQSSGEIDRAFSDAKKMSPTLLIIDDLHLLFVGGLHRSVEYTASLMECLDSLKEKDSKIFVLFTANKPEVLATALKNRPGRISRKIHFADYRGCLAELLKLASKEVGLRVSEEEIDRAVDMVPEEKRVLNPDEARNVCQSLHLQYRGRPFGVNALKAAIIRVFHEYHEHAAQAAENEASVRVELGKDIEF